MRRRLEALLEDERRFAWGMCGVVGVMAVLKGLRWPGEWALTQAQLDYSHGFVKRGLLGEVYRRTGSQGSAALAVWFFAEMVLLCGMLWVWVRRSEVAARVGTPWVAAVFTGSYAVTFLWHIVGYVDVAAACVAVGLLLVRDVRWRFGLGLPGVATGLLMHEAFLFLFLPVVVFSFAVDRAWWMGVMLGMEGVALTGWTALRRPMDPEAASAWVDAIDTRADFNIRRDFFQVLTVDLHGTMHGMVRDGWTQYRYWVFQAVGLCVMLPAVWVLVRMGRRVLREGGAGRWVRWGYGVAVFAPLGMHLLGLDGVRWDTWVVVDAMLALGLVCRGVPGGVLRVSVAERHGMVLAVVLGVASGWGLFDGRQVNPYPFFPKALQGVMERHDVRVPGF